MTTTKQNDLIEALERIAQKATESESDPEVMRMMFHNIEFIARIALAKAKE